MKKSKIPIKTNLSTILPGLKFWLEIKNIKNVKPKRIPYRFVLIRILDFFIFHIVFLDFLDFLDFQSNFQA